MERAGQLSPPAAPTGEAQHPDHHPEAECESLRATQQQVKKEIEQEIQPREGTPKFSAKDTIPGSSEQSMDQKQPSPPSPFNTSSTTMGPPRPLPRQLSTPRKTPHSRLEEVIEMDWKPRVIYRSTPNPRTPNLISRHG